MKPHKRLILNIATGCLLVLQLLPAVSAEVPLTAFEVNYDFFYGKMRVAVAQLSLTRVGDNWRWFLLTKPKGLLSLLIHKEPYSETLFTRQDGNLHIQKHTLADDGEHDKLLETASFDWNSKQVKMLYEGVSSTEALSEEVYDYLSVHLLSAKMLDENLRLARVDFYYKGRLIKLELKRLANATITINEKEIDTRVFEQSLQDSTTKSIYYYDPDTPFIPLKIETIRPEKKTNTMVLVPKKQ